MKNVALISGVAGGIGSAIADLFAENGWVVIGLDKTGQAPDNVDYYRKVDLSDPVGIETCVAELSQYMPKLNAIINNAATQVCKPILDTTVDEWDSVMNTNVRSVFVLTQQVHRYLKAGNGAIVNISSVHAVATSPGLSAYAASKGALSALTRSQAVEFSSDGIRANAILPGAIDTSMLEAGLKRGSANSGIVLDDLKKQLAQKTVSGTIGRPYDVAKMALYLADNECSEFITGQNFVVDGGALSRLGTE